MRELRLLIGREKRDVDGISINSYKYLVLSAL